MTDLIATATAWLDLDPANAGILAAEISAAQDGDDTARNALTARFAGYLTFGTAGLRAPLGPGTTRMNRVVVQRAAAGLADFALEGCTNPSVVIGYDARHGSKDFALDSARVLTAAGCRVRLMAIVAPTPVLAFALRHFSADIGIMVTASHNPPGDNGYKVYLGPRLVEAQDAIGAYAQITAPTDRHIAERIQVWNTGAELPPVVDEGWEVISETVVDDYVAAISNFVAEYFPNTAHRQALRLVYTPMHGVGAVTFQQLLAATGFAPPTVVSEQVDPDPAFPTVAFPNPEEPGALDLAFATADATPGCDLVIAHDPDADRLAVAIPTPNGWQRLTGDQVGLLLADRMMPLLRDHDLTIGNSVVSATQVKRLADHHGVHHETTPTGFKWICRVPRLGFGYEEALGYAVAPHLVNDKDGLSAAILLADLTAELKAKDTTLLAHLAHLTQQVGPTLSDLVAVIVPSPTVGTKLVDDLRASPPQELAGLTPVTTVDYQHPDVELSQRYGPMNMLELATTGKISARLMIRPSGTEPKIKCYVSVSALPGTPQDAVTEVFARLRDQAASFVEVK